MERFRTLQLIECAVGLVLSAIGWTWFAIVVSRCSELDSLTRGVCWSEAGGQEWDISLGAGFWAAFGIGVGMPLLIHSAVGLSYSVPRLREIQQQRSARWKAEPVPTSDRTAEQVV